MTNTMNTMINTKANDTNNSTIEIFENAEFGKVRTIMIDDEPYFVGKDVADILGYSNNRKALNDHVDNEDKNTVTIRDGIKGNPNQVVINESGLYSLILSSKLPNAKKFKRWVTSEVLPTIRKRGMYATDELLDNPDFAIQILTQLKAEREEKKRLSVENRQLSDTVVKLQNLNDILAEKNLEWTNRKALNYAVRTGSNALGYSYQRLWSDLYKELYYKHGISLGIRKSKYENNKDSLITFLHDDEYKFAFSSLVSIFKTRGVLDEIIDGILGQAKCNFC